MTVRNWGATAHAALGPSTQTRHFRRCAGLIDEHQPFRVEIRLGLEPCASPRENVGPLLLAGVRCFFSRSLSDDQENARSCSAQIRPHAAIKASRPVQQA
jgi:hypothetical protein